MIEPFFNENVLLEGESSKVIYREIKNLPIIDYHCHLDQKKIKGDATFSDIGELWLSTDHYKWRAMRLAGVDEKYITGDASYKEKFMKYASVVPSLIGNPLYYWTHFELKQVFGIDEPLNEKSAERIYEQANKKLKDISVRKLLKLFNIEFIATTDDPIDDLKDHGAYDGTKVTPTFRPDKLYAFDDEYLKKLSAAADIDIKTLDDLEEAISRRLDFFKENGVKISDHGFKDFPKAYADKEEAKDLFLRRNTISAAERGKLFGYLLTFLMREYKKRDIVVQIHFNVTRNINTPMFDKVGVDAGFDVIAESSQISDVIAFLNKFSDAERPTIILYSLNLNLVRELACVSGAFRNVYIGAAWWFNDTLLGIKHNLELVSEYAILGTNLGMLTDSRAFTSYSRFDFFRRILATFIGTRVDKGEYPLEDGISLAKNISYYNIKKLLGV